MRRAFLVFVSIGLVVGCGGGGTPVPQFQVYRVPMELVKSVDDKVQDSPANRCYNIISNSLIDLNLSPPEWESWKSKYPWWKIVEHDRGVYIQEDAATAKYDSLGAAKQGAERYVRVADRYMQTIETSPYHEEFKSACVQYISGHERDPWSPSK